jgi:predicted component of type VI protein secretion system
MAYVVVYHKDQEITRRKLEGPATIGRSLDCELSVHDILLSRMHCRIEPDEDAWVVSDLGSKNGTRVGGTAVFQLPLTDGDVIRMGNTAVRFRTAEFVPTVMPQKSGLKRPADPFEALAGTVRDFQFAPSTIAPNGIRLPTPKPSPKEPVGYTSDDVRTMVSELVSSSWDSIYENASRPDPVMTSAAMAETVRRRRPREPRIDPALQVHPEHSEEVEAQEEVPPLPLLPIASIEDLPDYFVTESDLLEAIPRRQIGFLLRRVAMIFQWLPLVMLMWG